MPRVRVPAVVSAAGDAVQRLDESCDILSEPHRRSLRGKLCRLGAGQGAPIDACPKDACPKNDRWLLLPNGTLFATAIQCLIRLAMRCSPARPNQAWGERRPFVGGRPGRRTAARIRSDSRDDSSRSIADTQNVVSPLSGSGRFNARGHYFDT